MDAVRKMGFISTNILFLLLYEARKHKEGQGFLVHPALMIRLPVCLSSLRAAP